VSEDTSHSQDQEENREDGEKEGDGANGQEEENKEKDNLDDREEQCDQGDAKQAGGGCQDNGEDRGDTDTDTEDAEDPTDNNSVTSGASPSSKVPVEDQALPDLEEAILDSNSDSSSISVPENLPPLPTSSSAPGSHGPTPHAVAPDQVSSSARQVYTPASSLTQAMFENDDSFLVALANVLGATIDPESLPCPFEPLAAASSNSAPTSNKIGESHSSDNLLGAGSQFETDTYGVQLDSEERGENNELQGEPVSERDHEHGSVSAPQPNSDELLERVSDHSAKGPTTPSSNSAASLPFSSYQSSTPDKAGPSSLFSLIPKSLKNLIANKEEPSSTSPSSIPLPASSPVTPSAATPTPPNPTFWHEEPSSSIPTNASAVPSSFSDLWSLMSPTNPGQFPFISSPLVNLWAPLPATNPSQASTPLTLWASASSPLSLRNITSNPEGGNLTDALASTVQQTNSVDRLAPASPGDTIAPQQEISSGDTSALFTPSPSSK
jgi:hypothetical protein